jgi:hypothetical protein
VIIDEIMQAINAAKVACFEVTQLNQNVLFEFGYAVGSDKLVWPPFDETDAVTKKHWERLRLLKTVGYVPCTNSDDIRAAFLRDSPHMASETLFERSLEPALTPGRRGAIFYMQSLHPTDASRALTRRVERQKRRTGHVIVADPSEASVYPLTWYAQQIYATAVTIVHLAEERRIGSEIHNARAALVAGLARGMGRPVLILAQEDYLAPVDYQDLAFVYPTARELVERLDAWLEAQSFDQPRPTPSRRAARLELKTELRELGSFGEPVAENEADELASYFIQTSSYLDVLRPRTTVFVGRKVLASRRTCFEQLTTSNAIGEIWYASFNPRPMSSKRLCGF